MTDPKPPRARTQTSQTAQGRAYKRSWKNLLINKKYQLRFTLFMVGLSTLLMVGLGIWVMRVADETTEVSKTSVRGTPCPRIPEIEPPDPEPERPSMKLDPAPEPAARPPGGDDGDEGGDGGEGGEAGGGGAAGGGRGEGGGRPRAAVTLEPSEMTIIPSPVAEPTVPADFGAKIVEHYTCELKVAGKLDDLERNRLRILWVLIGTGLLLVLGLAAYGIKMTHRVAGPLFKVGLYLTKMRAGRYDTVYNLRKGDQLVDFFEHFKQGHGGVVKMQRDDIARLKALVAAAESAGLGDHPTVDELRTMLARKEKSVE